MEEKLDKLISLMETQNKAWEKCLELLFSLAETMTADKKQRQILLEKHPPPLNTPTDVAAAANAYNDQYRYGADAEEDEQQYHQPTQPSMPPPMPQDEQPQQQEPPPPSPYTSRAEMMEQAEKRDTAT
jgi:hypothetical protein